MIAYKFTQRGGKALFSAFRWPLPISGAPGAWVEIDEPLEAGRRGLHACHARDLPYWLSEELFEVELEGEPLIAPTALVARRARLLRRVDAWSGANTVQFGHECAQRASLRVEQALQPSAMAQAYLNEALQRAAAGTHSVAAYAAALVCAALEVRDEVPDARAQDIRTKDDEQATAAALDQRQRAQAAFAAERLAQGTLLAGLLGL